MKRKHVLVLLAAVVALVACGLAANGLVLFLATAVIEGAWTLGIVASAMMLGWVLLRGLKLEGPGLLMGGTWGAAGLGAIAIAVMLMGWGGVLNRWTGSAVLLTGPVGWTALRGWRGWRPAWPEERVGGWYGWIVVAVFGAVALVGASLPPVALWHTDPVPYDALEYHLQAPREWFEGGRIELLKHNAYGAFPFNVEMHYLLAMHLRGGAWKATYLCQYLTLAHMGLACVAVAGGARVLAPARWAAGAAAGLFMATPWVVMLGAVAYNEAGLLLYGAVAVGWCVRWVRESAAPMRWLAIAGAMAGLACGVKLTAVPLLLVGMAVVLPVVGGRRAFAGVGLYVAAGALVFSPWMVRNAVWTGNPVWPEGMKLLGRGHFSERQVERWEAAHKAAAGERCVGARLGAFGKRVLVERQYGWVLWPLAILGAAASWRDRGTWVLALMLGGLAAFWVVFTHLQGRFFVLGVPIAALLAVRVGGRTEGRWMLTAATGALVLASGGFLWRGLRGPLEAGVFGVEDLSAVLDEPVREAVKTEGVVALAGDAQAYLYPVPMSRLRYRTVMDVDQQEGQDLVEAWVGQPEKGRTVIVSPSELRRFARTYRHIRVSERWAREPGTVILRE